MTRLAAAYVVGVAGVASYGFATDSTAAILLAAGFTLPSGVPGMIGFYVAYGLLALVPGANPSSSSGSGYCSSDGICHESVSGDTAPWFLFATDVLGVLALTGAALLNVALARAIRASRSRSGPRVR